MTVAIGIDYGDEEVKKMISLVLYKDIDTNRIPVAWKFICLQVQDPVLTFQSDIQEPEAVYSYWLRCSCNMTYCTVCDYYSCWQLFHYTVSLFCVESAELL